MERDDKNIRMTDEQFNEILGRAIDFLAYVEINGGLHAMEDFFYQAQRELKRRGMQTLSFPGDDRVAARIKQIEQEKAQARENDPEGYEVALKTYNQLLQKKLDESYKHELGEMDSIEENDSDIDRLEEIEEVLYKYEPQRRHWWDNLQILKEKVRTKKQAIIDNLPDDEKRALEIQGEIEGLEKSKAMDESLGVDAAWHQGDAEHNGYMSNMFRTAAAQTGDKIIALQEERDQLPNVSMSDILRRAIADVKISMEDVHDAKTQGLEAEKIHVVEGVDK